MLRVRATSKAGEVQTGVERDVVPDGATGWHEVEVTAEEAEAGSPAGRLPPGSGWSASVIT